MSNVRFDNLKNAMSQTGMKALALNPGPTLTYLTGLVFHLMERPTVLLVSESAPPAIILPELEVGKLRQSLVPLQPFPFNDNPASWKEAFQRACRHMDFDGKVIGVEPNRLRYLELNFLQNAAPTAKFTSADDILIPLRMRKDSTEISAMRKAVEIAQNALLETLKVVKAGISEREIAAELTLQLLRCGSDSETPFAPIVSTGPNTADPHITPSDRKLREGEFLLIDWGATYQGYVSDLTRTFAFGNLPAEMYTIYNLVNGANAAGRASGKPGIAAGEVDKAARTVIANGGYGEYFFHRVGHGLGMEGHEPPYMFGENSLVLEPGMAYTVEPGIYLAGNGGVRIEDDVIVTDTGCETLSTLPRELMNLLD